MAESASPRDEFVVIDRFTCPDGSLAPCPAQLALSLVGHKWSLHILIRLLRAADPIRFGQLQRSIPGISQRELTKHLRIFEQAGLVRRKVHAEVPPRVDYAMTSLGLSLLEPMTSLNNWSVHYGPQIEAYRAAEVRRA